MTFTNETATLPEITIDDLELSPVSPKYRVLNISMALVFLSATIAVIVLLDLGLFFTTPTWMSTNSIWLYGTVTIVSFINVIYHIFADPIIQYAVREQDVHFQSGLFFRKLVSQPILRVQHIELKRGPIERKAGLATLQVYSAGGGSYTFEIPGLEYERAISLRRFIINHKDLLLDE